jgi:hypothetical protein
MATHALAVIRLESATPERCVLRRLPDVLREITESNNLLRSLRYATLNDNFSVDDLRVALSFWN